MMGTVVLGPMGTSDAARCAELERILFPGDDPWSERAFREELRAGYYYVVARLDASAMSAQADRTASAAPADTGLGNTTGLVGNTRLVGNTGPVGDAGLVGYAGLAFIAGPGVAAEAEVHTIGVDPAHQGRGVGRALLRALLEVADAGHATVFLEVRTDNEAAHALYASEGFAVVGLRRRYYQPSGADAHTMRRGPQ